MKGLLKYLSPFAPDQSGAISVLYGLGGITVICDAGGCAGNVCGFDEPRWFKKKSALFSAGLRDMDAILGRDDRLVDKLKDAAMHLDAEFAALIGTPVPAVIATDFRALVKMAEKRCNIPVLAVDCTGTRLYDQGASDTYMALFQKFSIDKNTNDLNTNGINTPDSILYPENKEEQNCIGILGVNPLDTSYLEAEILLKEKFLAAGYDQVLCYGTDGLSDIKQAAFVKKNLVLSPSGLRAARLLEKKFGTPYETAYPLLKEALRSQLHDLSDKKVLVVHQQIAANEIRKEILDNCDAEVTVATWFLLDDELKKDGDLHLETEKQWQELVASGDFDVVIGDQMLKRAIPNCKGTWLHVPHFAVSGEYEDGTSI